MRQIVYLSSVKEPALSNLTSSILLSSRKNNSLSDVTGALYFDGYNFIQALEGPSTSLRETFARIKSDARHHGIVLIADRPILRREFGDWAMAYPRSDEDDTAGAIARLKRAAAGASPAMRAAFGKCPGLASLRTS